MKPYSSGKICGGVFYANYYQWFVKQSKGIFHSYFEKKININFMTFFEF